ncbi:MAG: hypothetical protein BWY31_01731 [Lentisphaerae bacterium ADurb.Bin242]|nr:MAG: hypothetical protein BWY31_01731 [Lentisphaerae bacterium ADurb.Bin242]
MDRREFLKSVLTLGVLGAVTRVCPLFAGMEPKAKNRTLGSAKSVIEIWIWGGPCQLEAFDPKPLADRNYNGGHKAIPTNVDGIFVSEYLPELAKQADRYSIIRSMTHPHRGHESATYLMQTGRMPGGGVTYPAIGAILAMMKNGNVRHHLPAYVALTTAKGRFSECGFLGEKYSPFATGGNPAAQTFNVDGYSPVGGLSRESMERRFHLAEELDSFGRRMKGAPSAGKFNQAGEEAKGILFGKTAEVFDLSRESKEMRERYGMNRFGQSCLAARRLVEQGVPYVTINASGWDTHKRHFETLARIAPEMDRAVATLLADLHERNMLKDTVIWWTGEFGRTPAIDWDAPWQGGRNHHSNCFCSMVAGGGFAGGRVVGSSDATTENVASRPVSPADLLGSIYELCGIDPDQPFPDNPLGLKTPILSTDNPKSRLRELYL